MKNINIQLKTADLPDITTLGHQWYSPFFTEKVEHDVLFDNVAQYSITEFSHEGLSGAVADLNIDPNYAFCGKLIFTSLIKTQQTESHHLELCLMNVIKKVNFTSHFAHKLNIGFMLFEQHLQNMRSTDQPTYSAVFFVQDAEHPKICRSVVFDNMQGTIAELLRTANSLYFDMHELFDFILPKLNVLPIPINEANLEQKYTIAALHLVNSKLGISRTAQNNLTGVTIHTEVAQDFSELGTSAIGADVEYMLMGVHAVLFFEFHNASNELSGLGYKNRKFEFNFENLDSNTMIFLNIMKIQNNTFYNVMFSHVVETLELSEQRYNFQSA